MEANVKKARLGFKFHYLYLITIAILFVMSIIVEKGRCVLFINGFNTPFQDFWFPIVTNLGDGLVFLLIVPLLLFVRFQYALVGTLVTVLSAVISSIFKYILFPGAARPKNYLDTGMLHFVPGVEVHRFHSFPSGHTITAFCAALLITLIVRDKLIGFISLILALLVGYSRIYLLQHFLVDVAAGAVIGCFTTYLVWQIVENTHKPEWMNGRININLRPNIKSNQVNQAS